MSKDIQALLEVAKEGDMIEFIRVGYSHWAIYIGEGRIIHLSVENDDSGDSISSSGYMASSIFGVQSGKATVMTSDISTVLQHGGNVRVNNSLDSKQKPLPVGDIIEKANNALGQKVYNIISYNCEHFATDCRYGQPQSCQVQNVFLCTEVILIAVCVVGFVIYIKKKGKKNKTTRK